MNFERFKVNNKNLLCRYADNSYSGGWRFVGVVKQLPFGRLGPIIPPEKVLEIKDWLFKNGKPKYRVIDIDHGTVRVWVSPNSQGVKSIYKEVRRK
jgi:hypothetical protein